MEGEEDPVKVWDPAAAAAHPPPNRSDRARLPAPEP